MLARILVAGCTILLSGAAAEAVTPSVPTRLAAAQAIATWGRSTARVISAEVGSGQAAIRQAAQPGADALVRALARHPRPSPPPAGDAGQDHEAPRAHGLSAAEQRALYRDILTQAAHRHHLEPGLVMAVAWWESGWDMSKVSSTGARGIMQVDPGTAQTLGPALLHRPLNLADPFDNADLGAAVLRADLDDAGGNLDVALASYYEGAGNVDPSNLDPGAQTYVDGVRALQGEFDAGQGPGELSPTPAPSPSASP